MKVAKRSDYTFKYNKKLGRHGWLHLTPAYSVKLVTEIIDNIPEDAFNHVSMSFHDEVTTFKIEQVEFLYNERCRKWLIYFEKEEALWPQTLMSLW